MPRARLTPQRIVDEAASIANDQGFDQITLAGLASRLDVRVPSLYKHVAGLADVKTRLAEQCRAELVTVIEGATIGRSGSEAIRALAQAIRQWAKTNPGKYAATVPAAPSQGPAASPATVQALTVLLNVISRGYPLTEDETIHQARAFRSAVHGFVALELAGGFGGLPVDIDESFTWMVEGLLLSFDGRTHRPPTTS